MELKIKRTDLLENRSEALMTHKGEEIEWNVSLFERTSNNLTTGLDIPNFDIFEQINGYWSYLQPAQQDKIFDVYRRVREVFDNVWNTTLLTSKLQVLVKELYQYHDLAEIRHWVDFHGNLRLPDNLKETFTPSYDNNGSREKTYLKEDYRWLVVLAIGVRAMSPLWGEFIARTRKEFSNTYKELYGFRLLNGSSIERSEPMRRLQVFVEQYTPTDKPMSAAIFGGLSSEDFPTWILALVVIRRLCVADLRGIDTNSNSTVISFIYKYIGQRIKSSDNSFIGVVKEKMVEGTSQEGENNLSKLEGYKIKQEIPEGDIVAIDAYLTLIQPVADTARLICPDIDLTLLDQALFSVKALNTELMQESQTTLMQWVLKAAAPPRGMVLVPKLTNVQAMAVTQACLWHRGYFELAGLATAIAQPHNGEMVLGGVESRAKITKEQNEELTRLFPYARRPMGKARPQQRQPNVGVTAIETMATLFSSVEWKLTLPAEHVARVTGNKNNRRYSAPHDIKVKLAQLCIAVAGRQF